jgi:G3E family GTPase
VPCTILTGSLGSGKTTVLNHILHSQHGKRIAVIENEWGKVGINRTLVQDSDVYQVQEDIWEATCGCLCRKVRGDLIRCLKSLKKRLRLENEHLDHIFIETTGIADPAALAQTFFADEFVAEMCSLDGILTLVDTERLVQQLKEDKDHSVVEKEVAKQLAYADRILLNKTDRVDKEALVQIKICLRKINPSVPILLVPYNQIDMQDILGIDAWSPHKVLDSDEGFLDNTIHSVITCHFREGLVKCYSMAGEEVFASHVPAEEPPFGPWLWRAAKEQIPKGRLHLVETNGEDIWIEPLQPFGSSVGIDIYGQLDKEKFMDWMNELMMEKNEELFRYKGILNIQGQKELFVFQGMQTRIMGGEHRVTVPVADDERRSKIHIMGNNLKREELLGGLMQCVALDGEDRHPLEAFIEKGAQAPKCVCQ